MDTKSRKQFDLVVRECDDPNHKKKESLKEVFEELSGETDGYVVKEFADEIRGYAAEHNQLPTADYSRHIGLRLSRQRGFDIQHGVLIVRKFARACCDNHDQFLSAYRNTGI